jgi:hypothetical protein
VRAAAAICGNEGVQPLRALWRASVAQLRAHRRPSDVPLRAPFAVLEGAEVLLRSPVNGARAAVIAGVPDALRVARERLLHHARRATPFQMRAFVHAAAAVARAGIPVHDPGLLGALVDLSVGPPAVWNAKRRGRAGTLRLVSLMEDLAWLNASRAGGAGALADFDSRLEGRVLALRSEVLQAAARNDQASDGGKLPAPAAGAAEEAGDAAADLAEPDTWAVSTAEHLEAPDVWRFSGEPEVAHGELMPPKAPEHTVEASLARMQWKAGAWDAALAERFATALDAVLGQQRPEPPV